MAAHQGPPSPALPLLLGVPLEIKRNIFSYVEIDSPNSLILFRLTHSIFRNALHDVDLHRNILALCAANDFYP